MSQPVQCFMLECVPKRMRFLCASTDPVTDGRPLDLCPDTGRPHRTEIEVSFEHSLDSIQTMPDGTLMIEGKPMACQCGFKFTQHNADTWASEVFYEYTNPKTGRKSFNAYQVATPGAVWYCPWLSEGEHAPSSILSDAYMRDWLGKRPPISIRCPDGSDWVVDQKASNGPGWTVTGEAPNLTAQPSIVSRDYHGWLRDGMLTEDLENREYPTT